jgi:hypothetical protein
MRKNLALISADLRLQLNDSIAIGSGKAALLESFASADQAKLNGLSNRM